MFWFIYLSISYLLRACGETSWPRHLISGGLFGKSWGNVIIALKMPPSYLPRTAPSNTRRRLLHELKEAEAASVLRQPSNLALRTFAKEYERNVTLEVSVLGQWVTKDQG